MSGVKLRKFCAKHRSRFAFTVAPADLVQDAETFLADPRSYIDKLQKLQYKGALTWSLLRYGSTQAGIREYKIKMPDDRAEILSEVAAASVYNPVIVFCKDFKSAERVIDKLKKAQPKCALVYNSHDKETLEKVGVTHCGISQFLTPKSVREGRASRYCWV